MSSYSQSSGYAVVGSDASKMMTDRIHCEVKKMVSTSRLVRRSDGIALVKRNELEVGKLLGSGAFSEVHEVRILNRDPTGTQTYAMKHLKAKLQSQSDNFRLAATELACEAHMLASFDHPNVMKIRGWAANGVASFVDGRHDSFFLLLDKLDETLDQRIEQWKQRAIASPCPTPSHSTGGIVGDLWRRLSLATHETASIPADTSTHLEKLSVSFQIAAALAYLHGQGVIFRDLKPNNIGFLNGRVQLFDFGLSRELPKLNLEEPFEMSGKVGTLRYMSPEVASHQVYNVSADVYSWAMVSYEIFMHDKPFQGWTRDMHADLVCGRGARPEASALPTSVRPVLEASWNQYAYRRPTMKVVVDQMRHLKEQQLVLVCNTMPSVSVELPSDFSMRKVAQRHPSETYTTATASLESLSADFMYQ